MPVAVLTVIDVLRRSTGYIAQRGSTSARLDAELLMAHALGISRLDLYLQHDRPLRDEELVATRALVRRRGHGEPVAYILGEREFYGRAFNVTRDVLIPRPETETLVEIALRIVREEVRDSVRVADLGTGSGCIAVTLAAEATSLEVIATDISDAALTVARTNAARHAVQDRITFLEGSWAEPLSESVEVVLCNPPYVSTEEVAATDRDVRDFEPHQALDGGLDGLDAYRAMLPSLHERLTSNAVLLVEVDSRRATAVATLIRDTFVGSRTSTHRDLAGRDRVIEARLP